MQGQCVDEPRDKNARLSSERGPSTTSSMCLGGSQATALPQAHSERVFDLAFDKSNRWMASASDAEDVKIWDVAANGEVPKLLQRLPHAAEVLRVAWKGQPRDGEQSRDGERVADLPNTTSWFATGTAAGAVRIYCVAAQAKSERNPNKSHDQKEAGATFALKTEFAHPGPDQQIYALLWLETTELNSQPSLMTAADDKIYWWDVESQSLTNTWAFDSVAPTTEPGNRAAYGGVKRNPANICYIFDAVVGELYPGQGEDVVCVALSDGSVRVLDRRSARTVARVQGAEGHLTALHLATHEHLLLACGGRGDVVAFDTRTFSVRAVLKGHGRPVFGAALVPPDLTNCVGSEAIKAPMVMTWSTDTTLRFFDLNTGNSAARHVVCHPRFPILTCAFRPGHRQLVLGGGTGVPEPHTHLPQDLQKTEKCCAHGDVKPPSLLYYNFHG